MCNFSEKGQEKGKIFENLGKNVQNLKIFWKRAGDCMLLSPVSGNSHSKWWVEFKTACNLAELQRTD